jgi:hypothetical protein
VQKARVKATIKQSVIFLVCAVLLLFIPFAFLRYSEIPVEAIVCSGDTAFVSAGATSPDCASKEGTLDVQLPFPVYAIGVMSVLGWLMLMVFLPVGMWAFCFDYVGAWLQRPVPMKKEEFEKAKKDLAD